jgi:hypothetical protein
VYVVPVCLQACVTFSIEELEKLEALLFNLHLAPEEASEMQAGVVNRLMDVYHKLTLQATNPEVRTCTAGNQPRGTYTHCRQPTQR